MKEAVSESTEVNPLLKVAIDTLNKDGVVCYKLKGYEKIYKTTILKTLIKDNKENPIVKVF